MNSRRAKIMETLVSEYIRTAEPVGSERLVRRYRLNFSSATIRNDFHFLTDDGYLDKPHSSSGRIPTNKGYRFYADAVIEKLDGNERNAGADGFVGGSFRKNLTEELSKFLGLMAVSFSEEEGVALVGTKYLFSQPDFSSRAQFENLAGTLEELHLAAEKLFEEIPPGESEIFIGKENPYLENEEISSLFAGTSFLQQKRMLIGIIGPTRMPYEKCWRLMKTISGS